MATDGPDPQPCDPEIFESGQTVVIWPPFAGSNAIERHVQKIARLSGQRVDWFFAGGRVVVRAIGDMERVMEALRDMEPARLKMEAERIAEYEAMFTKHGDKA